MNSSCSAEELALRVEIDKDSLVGIKVAQMTSWNVAHSDALVSRKSLADIGILQKKRKYPEPDRNQIICMCTKCVMPSVTV